MIELHSNSLKFTFPEVHQQAELLINFQRTLRIPDDDNAYPLPPGLGSFPLKHIDDYQVPAGWIERGGVMLPMYQSEALWISFNSSTIPNRHTSYPFAVKIAAGKINAVSGEKWDNKLNSDPQDYLVTTKQPWLDGYSVEKGLIRQFVAMPLGSGYSAEEQLTGKAEHGGIQIIVYPMKAEVFEKRFRPIEDQCFMSEDLCLSAPCLSSEMGLAPGGKMKQEIYEDPFNFSDWEHNTSSRCFVHIANSLVWRAITGEQPPTTPMTSKEYNDYGLPWFDYYDDKTAALEGSETLAKLKSIMQKASVKKDNPLPENEAVKPEKIKVLKNTRTVREGRF